MPHLHLMASFPEHLGMRVPERQIILNREMTKVATMQIETVRSAKLQLDHYHQNATVQVLHELFIGLMSKITYALPAFAGHLTADDRN